jgi:hypothetical protein
MSLFKDSNSDSVKLNYLIMIRWQMMLVGACGLIVVLVVFGFNQQIIIAGTLGGLGFSLGLLGSSLERSYLLLMAVILFLLAIYILPSFGRESRGQVISYFFFTGMWVLSLALCCIDIFLKVRS